MNKDVAIARLDIGAKRHESGLRALRDVSLAVATSPVLAAMAALLLNQLAYKAGFYDPRSLRSGEDVEGVAGGVATAIETMIFTATAAYAVGAKPNITYNVNERIT